MSVWIESVPIEGGQTGQSLYTAVTSFLSQQTELFALHVTREDEGEGGHKEWGVCTSVRELAVQQGSGSSSWVWGEALASHPSCGFSDTQLTLHIHESHSVSKPRFLCSGRKRGPKHSGPGLVSVAGAKW